MSASHDSKIFPQNSFKLFTEKEIEDFLAKENWNDYHGKIETLEAETILFQQKIEKFLSLAPQTINRLMQEDIKAYAQIKGVTGLGTKETVLPTKSVQVVDDKDPSQTYDIKVPDLSNDKLVNFADWYQEKYLLYHFCFLLNGYLYYKKTKSTLDLAIEKEALYLTLEEEMRLALNAYQVRKECQRLLLIENFNKRKSDLEKLVTKIIEEVVAHNLYENYIPCGWIGDKGHALYLAVFFLKENNEVVIRIDNSGREETTILGYIKLNEVTQKKLLINYLVDAISQLIETNGEIAKPVIYNTQQSKYNFEILQNDYEFLPKQKTPNCVVEGYRRGMWYRLFGKYSTKEDALYHWLLRKSEEYAAVSHDVKDDGAKQKQLRARDRRDNEKLKERMNNLAIIQKTHQQSDSTSSGTVRDTKTIYHNSPPATGQDTQFPMQELLLLSAHADGKDSKAEITNTLSASGLATVISAAGVAAQQAGLFASTAQPNTNRRMVFGSAVASGEGATATTINRLTEDPSSKGKETFLTPAVASQMTQDDRKSNQHALPVVSPMQMATATAPGATAAVFNIDKFIMQSPATTVAEPDIKMQQTINRYHVSSITSEEKSFFVEKIKTEWRENNKEHQADLALYISSTATERMDDEKSFDLESDVHQFLKSESRVMLLLGSSGLGKTLFGYYLEQQLWRTYQSELSSSQPIPLFIPLARLKHPNTEAVEETLKAIGFEEKNFPSLKKLPFLFILDGADEINVRSNLYSSNKLDTWPNAKVMFTCRLEYLMQPVCEYRHWFQPSSHHIKRTISETVVERFIAPFSLVQIENYLKKYIEKNKENLSENWRDWKQYWHYFNEIPGLLKLIESPYLLYIASSVLPDLVKQQNLDAKSQDKQEITRLSLYDAFVKYYFLRHIEKPKQHELSHLFKDTQSNVEETLLEYNQQIAIKLHEIDQVSIAFQPEKVKTSLHTRLLTVPSAINPWVEFFGPDSKIQSKLLASPIKKTGDNHYAFLHPSLRDYFIARELFDQLIIIMPPLQSTATASVDNKQRESSITVETLFEQKMTQQILQANPPFAKLTLNVKDKLLRYERQVLDFMVERLREPKHKAVLWAIVERSKQDATVAKAAANAITILNAAGVSFASRDLRKINIPGADLSFGILDNAQLQGANMTQVNLQGAWLREANLSGAQLKNINFGELPLFQLKDECYSIQYSPDGLWLAVASGQEIIVYNAQNRECIQTLTGHKGYVFSVAWDHESKRLASGGTDKTVRLWEASSGKELWVRQKHTGIVNSVAWDHESKRLVSGSWDKTVRLWDASSGEALRVLQGHTRSVNSVAWDHESKRLASGSGDNTVRLWKASSGEELRVLQGHTGSVSSVAWDHESKRLASGSDDSTVRLWKTSSGEELQMLQGHGDNVTSVAWDHESKRLASGSNDDTVRLWDASSGKELRVLKGHMGRVNSIAWDHESKRLASGSDDKTMRLWEASSEKELRVLQGHTLSVSSIAWDHESKRLASGSGDNTVRLWEASSGKALWVLQGHTDSVNSIAWDHESKRLASGSDDKTVRLWEASSGKALQMLQGHTSWVKSVAWDHESKRLASGSKDKTVRLWKTSSGTELWVRKHTNSVNSVAWDHESKRLALGSDDGTVRLWEASSGKELRMLRGHKKGVISVAWDNESKHLASGSDDGTVRLWETSSGEELQLLQGHTKDVNSVAWDNESKYLASGSNDKTVRIWKVATGNLLGYLQFPYDVTDCAWATSTPGQERLAVAFGNGIACFTLSIGNNSFKAELNWLAIPGIPLHASQVNIMDAIGLSASNQLLLEQHNAIGKPSVMTNTAFIDSKDAKDSKQAVTASQSTSTATAATGTATSSAGNNAHVLFAKATPKPLFSPKPPIPPKPQLLPNTGAKK